MICHWSYKLGKLDSVFECEYLLSSDSGYHNFILI